MCREVQENIVKQALLKRPVSYICLSRSELYDKLILLSRRVRSAYRKSHLKAKNEKLKRVVFNCGVIDRYIVVGGDQVMNSLPQP